MQTSISSQQERDQFKKECELQRERGELVEALEGFEQILEWDKANCNNKGYIDVLGHVSICLKLMAENEEDIQKKKDLTSRALEIATEAVEKAKELGLPAGSVAIQQVHQAQAFLAHAEFFEGDAKKAQLITALETIEESIKNFPGSVASKAWPQNAKAQIQFKNGDIVGAMDSICQGQRMIYEGYEEQMKEDNNSDLKIKIWLSGLYLSAAVICKETKRDILSKYYANAVLALPDEEGHLVNRKNQAQALLK